MHTLSEKVVAAQPSALIIMFHIFTSGISEVSGMLSACNASST